MQHPGGNRAWARRPIDRYWLLLAALWLGFLVRAYHLDSQSLWFDEGFSAYISHLGFSAGLDFDIRWGAHPPLYYWLLTAWREVTGSSEFALRFPAVVFGALLLPVIYQIGRQLGSRRLGSVALLLAAVSPILVGHSQQVRMYTLATFLSALATYWLLSAWREGGTWRTICLWGICAGLTLFTLYLSVFLFIGQACLLGWVSWLNWRADRALVQRMIRRMAMMTGLIAVVLSPWLPAFFSQVADPAPDAWRTLVPLPLMLVESIGALAVGLTADGRDGAWFWVAAAAGLALCLLGVAARAGGEEKGRALPLVSVGLLCMAGAGIPLLLVGLISYGQPLFHPRYVVILYPPVALSLAHGLIKAWQMRASVAVIILLLFVGGGCLSLYNLYYSDRYALDDFRGAVRDLEQEIGPGDTVIVSSGSTFPAMAYYLTLPVRWRGPLQDYARDVLPRPAEQEQGITLVQVGTIGMGRAVTSPDDVPLSADEALAGLTTIAQSSARVWYFRMYDTMNDPLGLVRNWLDANMRMADERYYRGDRLQLFLFVPRDPAALLPRLQQTTDLHFANGASLRGLSVAGDALVPGGSLWVTLYWSADRPISADYQLFVHVVTRDGRSIAQVDGPPLGGYYPTSRWQPGDLIPETQSVHLPADAPPGQYTLVAGQYDLDTSERVRLETGEDAASVGGLVVRPPQPDAGQISSNVAVALEGGMQFLGGWVAGPSSDSGEMGVTLYWGCQRPPEADYTVFVHVVDATGALIAQSDGEPAEGNFPTRLCRPGDVIPDRHVVSLAGKAVGGEFQVLTGLYQLSTGRRLKTEDGSETIRVESARSR